jgi:hypothetical protein
MTTNAEPLDHQHIDREHAEADWEILPNADRREEFGKDEGRLLLKRVIDASIKAGADAQDHLLSMQEHGLDGRSTRSVRRPRVPRQEKASPVPHPFGPLPGAN